MKEPKQRGKGSFTRMCSGCGVRKMKSEMIRIAKNKGSEPFIDETGKGEGRGAYVCRETGCVLKLMKTRRLSRLLKTEIGDAVYQQLLNIVSSETEK